MVVWVAWDGPGSDAAFDKMAGTFAVYNAEAAGPCATSQVAGRTAPRERVI